MSKPLDYIVCPIDTNNYEVDDPDAKMDDDVARQAAEACGWDASDAQIVHMDESLIDQWFNANGARKRVGLADEWTYDGDGTWLSCFRVTWEDYDAYI